MERERESREKRKKRSHAPRTSKSLETEKHQFNTQSSTENQKTHHQFSSLILDSKLKGGFCRVTQSELSDRDYFLSVGGSVVQLTQNQG